MSPLGLVVYSFIISSLISLFVGCTPNPSKTECPNDWLLDPTALDGTDAVINCPSLDSSTFSSCYKSNCNGFPVCQTCIVQATEEKVPSIECSNGFLRATDETSPTMCVDKKKRVLTCSGLCHGSLVCTGCLPSDVDEVPPGRGNALQRRANPFSASMYTMNAGNSNTEFFGENFNLRS
ncbi:hypothetical protein CROQUDRAFT_656287 [Cronartium quercuum f. sp. fusiforme G11]|uniref:Uncharacterized protein n=1 Tax=Cronartium quercuum f. sp. fusiforme G11 TaxID=708437 RepID=A0A9P6NKN9_9BASI|nr:hypothetical protein CROQUDRAFT_656287 [Cronartium quercuum f. sp. fusiforme G11]